MFIEAIVDTPMVTMLPTRRASPREQSPEKLEVVIEKKEEVEKEAKFALEKEKKLRAAIVEADRLYD